MSEMISVASGFQYSVNIGYDLNSDEKLKNFIPTRSALDLLEDILMSTNVTSSDRARVLVGAYGKGKSHIVLMILSMLMKKDLGLFEKTMPKIRDNPRLLQLVKNYYDGENRILPVIVTGSNTSLTQAFLLALQRTLSENDLLNAMPETNYKAAIGVINRWKNEFPKTYKAFQVEIDEPINKFVEKLENYDVSAYEAFERAYPVLTSGSVFNPFLGFDVVELYESVAKGLKANGYTGVYVVYDEFSKYVEANITDASVSDTKMLQDFAEKCARSGNLQMHLMLISHKEISNYIGKLPQQKIDGWRGVSERFKHIHMNNNFAQTYEIISTVIQKKKIAWGEFCKKHEKDFSNLYQRYQKHLIFSDTASDLDVAIKGCYPLQPVSTFILPRLSEKVAQNERTLFTFLSARGTSTLPSFLDEANDEEFRLITPDRIYDYFEPLFKKEVYAGSIHSQYVLTNTILNQLKEDSLGSKIVKTISLIYILEQYEKLKPTREELVGIYSASYDVDTIQNTINELIEKEFVIYLKRSNDFLRLKQTSGVDIQQKIHDLVESQSRKVTVKDTLNESNFDNYMYPSRYNHDHEMIRYFSFEFIEGSEIDADIDWKAKSESIKADGVIYGIIPSCETDIKKLAKLIRTSSKGHLRYVFVLPKHYNEIESVIREYKAVITLRDKALDDPVLFDEYEVVFEDLHEIIKGFINTYTHPEHYSSLYIHDGKTLVIHRKAALTELMSGICDEVYSQTPIINNESVNRNEITKVATTSRNKIISGLLRGELEPNLGLTGTGQEVSIMRSTLIRTGIWLEEGGMPSINLQPNDDRMHNMLSTIENFILEARQNGSMNFGVLYERLTAPEYHIGLRYGVIPIYIAAVMHEYRQQVVIADRIGQIPTNSDVLMQINADPSSFSLEYLDWNPEKEAYIDRLSAAFSDTIVGAEKSGNSYDYVANAMRRWFMALPKYSKECKSHPSGRKIVKRQLEMMRLLRQNTSSSDMLFKKLPEAFNYQGEFTEDVAEEIINTKILYDGLLDELKAFLVSELKNVFLIPGKKETLRRISLTSALKEWSDSLDSSVFEQLFPDGTDKFLELLKSLTNDEELFISRAAKLATDLRIEDWDGKTYKLFIETIKRYKKTAEEFHSNAITETINETNSYQITFADEEGKHMTKRFDKVDVSSRGKLLFNQITSALDSMGHSITEQEKRQILMEVLKKLC